MEIPFESEDVINLMAEWSNITVSFSQTYKEILDEHGVYQRRELDNFYVTIDVYSTLEGALLDEICEAFGVEIGDLEIMAVKRVDPDDDESEIVANSIYFYKNMQPEGVA